MSLHPVVHAVTERIRQRSARSRAAYLAAIDAMYRAGPLRERLSCANLAHGFAACGHCGNRRPLLHCFRHFQCPPVPR